MWLFLFKILLFSLCASEILFPLWMNAFKLFADVAAQPLYQNQLNWKQDSETFYLIKMIFFIKNDDRI